MQPGNQKHGGAGNESDALEDAQRARVQSKHVLGIERVADQAGDYRASGEVGQAPLLPGFRHCVDSLWLLARLTSDSILFRLECRMSVPWAM